MKPRRIVALLAALALAGMPIGLAAQPAAPGAQPEVKAGATPKKAPAKKPVKKTAKKATPKKVEPMPPSGSTVAPKAQTTYSTGPAVLRDKDGNVIPTTPDAYPVDSARKGK